MSREMKIKNGPCFRHLAFETNVLKSNGLDSLFTMSEKRPADMTSCFGFDQFIFQIKLFGINRIIGSKDEEDDFILLGFDGNWAGPGIRMKNSKTWYYILHYNTKTRKGSCREYNEEEFFSSNIIQEMFET
ncbi:MAG: hypothetical protein WAV11_02055 [Minisyncoccia bacterium]